MNKVARISGSLSAAIIVAAVFGLAAAAEISGTKVTLSGAQEVPPVTTSASGSESPERSRPGAVDAIDIRDAARGR